MTRPQTPPPAWIAPSDAGELAEALAAHRDAALAITGAPPPDAAPAPGAAGSRPPENLPVLSIHRLDRTLDHQPEDLLVAVEAGARVSELRRVLAREERWLPPATFAPPGEGAGSCGGLVAAAPPTPADAAFGPVRRQVLACTVVTRDGQLRRWGRGVVKNVAGYDLPRLWAGSRGRLGALAAVTFRTWPAPPRLRRYGLQASDGGDGAPQGADGALEVLDALATVPTDESFAPDALSWRPRDPAGRIWLLGSAASVEARERRLLRWARERGLRVVREADGPFDPSEPALTGATRGRDATGERGPTGRSAATGEPGATGERGPSARVGDEPPGGERPPDGLRPLDEVVLRISVPPVRLSQAARGLRETLGEGVGSLRADPAAGLLACTYRRVPGEDERVSALAGGAGTGVRIAVARGGEAEHGAAEARRPEVTRTLEARVVAALGGGERAWLGDYL